MEKARPRCRREGAAAAPPRLRVKHRGRSHRGSCKGPARVGRRERRRLLLMLLVPALAALVLHLRVQRVGRRRSAGGATPPGCPQRRRLIHRLAARDGPGQRPGPGRRGLPAVLLRQQRRDDVREARPPVPQHHGVGGPGLPFGCSSRQGPRVCAARLGERLGAGHRQRCATRAGGQCQRRPRRRSD